jgi:hypothetical protein
VEWSPFQREVFGRAQQAYLDFEGGLGVRAVHYNYNEAEFYPIEPRSFYYTFRGLMEDYYITFWSPIDVQGEIPAFPSLEGMSTQQAQDAPETYIASVDRWLNSRPSEAFTPCLDILDALVQSFQITEPIVIERGEV